MDDGLLSDHQVSAMFVLYRAGVGKSITMYKVRTKLQVVGHKFFKFSEATRLPRTQDSDLYMLAIMEVHLSSYALYTSTV